MHADKQVKSFPDSSELQNKKKKKTKPTQLSISSLESFPAERCVKMDFKTKSDFWGDKGARKWSDGRGRFQNLFPSPTTSSLYPLLQCWWPCLKMKSYPAVHRSRNTSQTGNWTETRFLQADCIEWNLNTFSTRFIAREKSELYFHLKKHEVDKYPQTLNSGNIANVVVSV